MTPTEPMLANRSMLTATVIPELAYADVLEAARWLCGAFGFRPRLWIGDHRAQLSVGDGAVIVTTGAPQPARIMVRVDDLDQHFRCAAAAGAVILLPPATYPYGERQYSCADPGGHIWTFSQSIADIDPAAWGGAMK